MSNELKPQKTFSIGSQVTVKWATHSSYEYEYESGIVTGAFIDEQNTLIYMVRIDGETKKVPYYQIDS